MRRSFNVLEGTYKAKAAFVLFLVLKKTYLPARLIIICSIGGAVLFGSTGSPQVCVFLRGIMVSASRGSLMSSRIEGWSGSGALGSHLSHLDSLAFFLFLQYWLVSCCAQHPSWRVGWEGGYSSKGNQTKGLKSFGNSYIPCL